MLPWFALIAFCTPHVNDADIPLSEFTLHPGQKVKIDLDVGKSIRVPFNCSIGSHVFGADALIHLDSILEHSDPFLVVSNDENVQWVGTSSFDQWQDDAKRQSILVRNVGAKGGSVDVYNINNLATESLLADLIIHCAMITVYDFLFWRNIKDKDVCPLGANGEMCSGRGECDDGACQCDGAQGIACDHLSNDIVMAHGAYGFDLASGSYHFYRIQVPATFPGGYLEVATQSDSPIVLLLRRNAVPTKAIFDQCNFGDWLRHKTESKLLFPVPPGSQAPDRSHVTDHRRMQLVWQGPSVHCPDLATVDNSALICNTPRVKQCEQQCLACIECMETKVSACRFLCEICSQCADVFLPCAEKLSCRDPASAVCETSCGTCMGCLDANDPNCASCGCCGACLPWAAKCGALNHQVTPPSYIFVGVFNHRFYYNDHSEVSVKVNLELHEEPHWRPKQAEWIDELYDRGPLKDIDAVRQANNDYDGKHVYKLTEVPGSVTIRVYHDRVSLVHVVSAELLANVEARVNATVKISHMLVSSARPKTFFDFTRMGELDNGVLKIVFPENPTSVWYAIFAKTNGEATLRVTTAPGAASFIGTAIGLMLVSCALCLLWSRHWARSRAGIFTETAPLQLHASQDANFNYPSFREDSFREDVPLTSGMDDDHMPTTGMDR